LTRAFHPAVVRDASLNRASFRLCVRGTAIKQTSKPIAAAAGNACTRVVLTDITGFASTAIDG
jgi:hypothetical protein